jgi:hypothetical protein
VFLASILLLTTTEITAEDNYGAIAYSQSTRRYGYSWGKRTREEAERTAIRECGANDAFVAVQGRNTWLAIAHGRGTSYGWSWSDESEQAARDEAVLECAKRAGGCHVLYSLYSGGQGTANLIARVPPGTRVFIGDYELGVKDGIAEFESPKILGGKEYVYVVKARLTIGAETFEEDVSADIAAFYTTKISFLKLEDIADRAPRAANLPDLPGAFFPTSEP